MIGHGLFTTRRQLANGDAKNQSFSPRKVEKLDYAHILLHFRPVVAVVRAALNYCYCCLLQKKKKKKYSEEKALTTVCATEREKKKKKKILSLKKNRALFYLLTYLLTWLLVLSCYSTTHIPFSPTQHSSSIVAQDVCFVFQVCCQALFQQCMCFCFLFYFI